MPTRGDAALKCHLNCQINVQSLHSYRLLYGADLFDHVADILRCRKIYIPIRSIRLIFRPSSSISLGKAFNYGIVLSGKKIYRNIGEIKGYENRSRNTRKPDEKNLL